MPLSPDDQQVFDVLAEASRQYEQYLEVAKIAQVPVLTDQNYAATPPPTNAPLTLVYTGQQ